MRYLNVKRGRPPGAVLVIGGLLAAGTKVIPEPLKKQASMESVLQLEGGVDGMKTKAVKDSAGAIVDYTDVTLTGYLSTWGDPISGRDIEGDYVLKGAFADSIPRFMQRPVLLVDHRNDVKSVAGSFVELTEDEVGLRVRAVLSNSPAAEMRDIRFKVAEGHLNCMSMGGLFYYDQDGHGIKKVELLEGSLTPVPANPNARILTRRGKPVGT